VGWCGATADEDDVELTEFSDERNWGLGYWEFAKIGLDTQSILSKK
jgi:hypothetical protein